MECPLPISEISRAPLAPTSFLRAIHRALEGCGYTSRGPAPGFHGASQCDVWEKDGQSYVISCKASRGRLIAYQPTFDRTRTHLLSVRSLDDADKVCAAMIDLRRDLIQVFLFEKADVRECSRSNCHRAARSEQGPQCWHVDLVLCRSSDDKGRPGTALLSAISRSASFRSKTRDQSQIQLRLLRQRTRRYQPEYGLRIQGPLLTAMADQDGNSVPVYGVLRVRRTGVTAIQSCGI